MNEEALATSGAAGTRAGFAHIPVAQPQQLAGADAILFGTPTRFGMMTAPMRNFLDQTGGTPYGATTLAGADGSRQPSANELAAARFQGKHVAGIAARLKG